MSRVSPKQATLFDSTTYRHKFGGCFENIPTLTVGKAMDILEKVKEHGLTGMSRVNKSLTKEQAYQLLSSGLNDLSDDKPIGYLHAKNIVCEFGNDYIKIVGLKG